jgi:hypothetical protein
MELTLRNPLIENWAIFLVFTQAFLLGVAYYRSYGGLFYAILDSGRKITLGSRVQLDLMAKTILYVNTFIGVLIFISWYLVDAYYVNTSLFIGFIGALFFLIFWHLDYLIFWSMNEKSKIAQQYISIGNVSWFLFGISLAISNALLVFNANSDWGAIIFFSLLGLALVLRVVNAFLLAAASGFSWYYIILYLCTVYLLPIVLIKKLFGAFWLELLTH